jgi:TolB-like protein
MLRIRMLGGAVVEGTAGAILGAAAQRKSLALLALLAAAGDRGMSRDKIIAYLWPETDPERAGHRLTQLLYALRRDCGADDLFVGSSELRLNPARIESDVQRFAIARSAGELEQAVALYGGPFLDGFFLADAPEFERWIENERADLSRDHAEALETLAAEAGARGDHRRAAQWWQRLANHDPLSSRVTVHLMSALAAAGHRAAALDRARVYQESLRRELEADANPAVLALAEQLRRHPLEAPPRSAASPVGLSIGVLPFANLSPLPRNDRFAEGVTEELTSALAQLEGVRVAARTSVNVVQTSGLDAQEIGKRLNVTLLVEGSVRQSGNQVRLHAQLVDVADGCSLWSARYERVAQDAFAVQDELTGLIVQGVRAAMPHVAGGGGTRPSGSSDG